MKNIIESRAIQSELLEPAQDWHSNRGAREVVNKRTISSINAIGRYSFVLWVVTILAACGSAPLREPVPPMQINQAGIPNIPHARFWGDEWPNFERQQLSMLTEDDL